MVLQWSTIRKSNSAQVYFLAVGVAACALSENARATLIVDNFNAVNQTWNAGGSWTGGTIPNGSTYMPDIAGVKQSGSPLANLVMAIYSSTSVPASDTFTVGAIAFDSNSITSSDPLYFDTSTTSSNNTGITLAIDGGNAGTSSPSTADLDLITLTSNVTGTVDFRGNNGALTIALNAAGNIDVVNAVATLAFDTNGGVSGTNGLTKTGAGTLFLMTANSNLSGGVTINGGTLETIGASPLGVSTSTTTINSATLQFTGSVALAGTRGISLGSSGSAVDATTGTVEIPGLVSGLGTLNVNALAGDIGTIELTDPSNSWSGGVVVDAGVFQAASGAVLGTAPASPTTNITIGGGAIQFTGNANLSANRGVYLTASNSAVDATTGNTVEIPGVISGPGTLNVNALAGDVGTIELTGTSNTWSGGVVVDAGVFEAASGAVLGKAPASPTTNITIDVGAIQFTGGANLSPNRSVYLVASNSAIDATTGTVDITGQITGSGTLNVNVLAGDTGTVELNTAGSVSANTWSGGLVVHAGMLEVGANTILGDVPASPTTDITLYGGTTLQFDGSISSTPLDPNRGIAIGSAVAGGTASISVATSNVVVIDGVVADNTGGAGTLDKIGGGALLLTGVNTFTGGTSVSAGQLNIDGSLSATGTVAVSSGATIGGSGKIGGSVNVASDGILSPGEAYSYNLTNGGPSSSGPAAGVLTIDGGLTLGDVSGVGVTLQYDLGSSNGSDLVKVAGDLTINPGLTLAVNPDSVLAVGTYYLVDSDSSISDDSSEFSGWNATGISGFQYGFALGTDPNNANAESVELIVSVPEPSAAMVGVLLPAFFMRRNRRKG